MSADAVLAVVILGPPALFGVFIAAEEWTWHFQAKRARRRHPSHRDIPVEDRPEWFGHR